MELKIERKVPSPAVRIAELESARPRWGDGKPMAEFKMSSRDKCFISS